MNKQTKRMGTSAEPRESGQPLHEFWHSTRSDHSKVTGAMPHPYRRPRGPLPPAAGRPMPRASSHAWHAERKTFPWQPSPGQCSRYDRLQQAGAG